MTRTSRILEVRNLAKRYRGRRGVQANAGIDLDVDAGQIVGLLGHNGAGKTTLVNQIVGLVRPDAGTIHLAGIDAIARPAGARAVASLQAQANVPITGLTPRSAVTMIGRLRGASARDTARRTERLFDALDLGPWADTRAEKISGGVARLTAFCMAAVVPGTLLILDEPTNDVDPVRRRALWNEIARIAADGVAILLVTHNVTEAERAVDQLTILEAGKVCAAGTPSELTAAEAGQLTLSIDVIPGHDPGTPPQVPPLEITGTHALTRVPSELATPVIAWAQKAAASGQIGRYSLVAPSLDDVYVTLTGRSHPAEAAPADAAESALAVEVAA